MCTPPWDWICGGILNDAETTVVTLNAADRLPTVRIAAVIVSLAVAEVCRTHTVCTARMVALDVVKTPVEPNEYVPPAMEMGAGPGRPDTVAALVGALPYYGPGTCGSRGRVSAVPSP